MQSLLTLISLILTYTVFSQSIDTLFIESDTIATRTINFYEDWKYRSGDDSSWADPIYDDSEWDIIDSRLIIDDSLNIEWKELVLKNN